LIGLEVYFYDQSTAMKASIYTIFLCTIYLKVICPYLNQSLAKTVHTLAEGIQLSIFIILALKI